MASDGGSIAGFCNTPKGPITIFFNLNCSANKHLNKLMSSTPKENLLFAPFVRALLVRAVLCPLNVCSLQ